MLKKILNGLQSLHFYTLTVSPTRANYVEKRSKVGIISLIGLTMCVLFIGDGKTQLGVNTMVSRNAQ
jgi:hypothetical protein